MEITEIIRQSTINPTANSLSLPDIQLDRNDYLKLKKQLETIGGKWNTKTKSFLFPSDPAPLIQSLLASNSKNPKKDFQFFQTPKEIATLLTRYLSPIQDTHKILESSAGQGALIKAIHAINPNPTIDCFELMETNRTILQSLPNINLLGDDFLKASPNPIYDTIIMNPPFSKSQDTTHVRHAYRFLNPTGTLIAITSTHWTFANDRKSKEFREWLYSLDDSFEILRRLDNNEFRESGTNISTIIIRISKQQ